MLHPCTANGTAILSIKRQRPTVERSSNVFVLVTKSCVDISHHICSLSAVNRTVPYRTVVVRCDIGLTCQSSRRSRAIIGQSRDPLHVAC